METATREMTFLLAAPERHALRWMAARMPRAINSNHLTGLGVVGAVGTGAAYALSGLTAAWLWVASAMLVINWFGDSLDGTLARVRHAERPWYGYYLDHIVDAFSTVVVGIGIGLSPYVSLELALIAVVLYLTLSINVYLETHVYGVFKLSYGWLGPTEARIVMILANATLAIGVLGGSAPVEFVTLAANLVVAMLALAMLSMLVVRFGRNLSKLAKRDPRKRVA